MRHVSYLLLALGLIVAAALLSGPWIADAQAIGGLLLFALVPGLGLTVLLFGQDTNLDGLDAALLTIALGLSVLVVGALALQYVPGPLLRTMLLTLFGLVSVGSLLLVWIWGPRIAWSRLDLRVDTIWPFLLVMAVALGLRLVNLSYSEFQGDEGRAVLRAAEVLQGNDEVLFLHKKGPVEILVPAAIYGVTGRLSEWSARMPFALASIGAVLGVYVLGRRIWGRWVGLMAAALAAIDGFFVGFARIVQYQSVVLLMTVVCVFAAYRLYQGAKQKVGYLVVIGLCAGTALLAHYEGVFLLPPVLFLLWMSVDRGPKRWVRFGQKLILPAIVGGLVTLSFYIPFVLHPHFGETASYLGEKRVGGALLYNNLADFCERAMFYNAPLYVALVLGGLFALGFGVLMWRGRGRYATLLATVLGLAMLAMGFFPSLWQVGGVSLAVFAFIAAVIALYVRSDSVDIRLLICWSAPVVLLYFFMMLKVHTHYYVTFMPWMLATAAGMGWLLRPLDLRRWSRVVVVAIGAVVWVGLANHTALAFVRHDPEYRHAYPESRPGIYWSPYGATMPRGGYFGFPYRTAWKAVGEMYAEGLLVGPYESNQEDLVTNWYTRGQLRCPTSDLFIVARNVENPHAIIPGVIDGTFMPRYEIARDGSPQVWVYERGYAGEMTRVDYDDSTVFDERLSRPTFAMGVPLDEVFGPVHVQPMTFGEGFYMAGWTMERELIPSGDTTMLTLYWRSLGETAADMHVFVHVGDEAVVAQSDSIPRCGQSPTYRWTKGQEIVDRHVLAFDHDAEGVYPVRMGMYDYGTKNRLQAVDAQGSELGSSVVLGYVRVGRPIMSAVVPERALGVFGGLIALDQASLSKSGAQAGDEIVIDVTWRCLAEMDTPYTVFLHLVGPDGQIRGQADVAPRGGALPTNFWVAGEQIEDQIRVALASDAPMGDYQVLIGVYHPVTWARLPVADATGEVMSDGALVVGQLIVGE